MSSTAALTERVTRALTRHLPPGRELPPDTNFFECGLTSRHLAAAVTELTEAGLPVALLDFFRHATVDQLVAQLRSRSAGRPAAPTLGSAALPWER